MIEWMGRGAVNGRCITLMTNEIIFPRYIREIVANGVIFLYILRSQNGNLFQKVLEVLITIKLGYLN